MVSDAYVPPENVDLPPELDAYLMDLLAYNSNALKSCALVSKAWLAASRVCLFRDITVESETMFLRFEEVLITSPMIGDCVRTLRFRGRELSAPLVQCCLSRTLPVPLSRLEAFEFRFVQDSWKPQSLKDLAKFTTITRISLVECSLYTEELFGIISAFPFLKDLRVADIDESVGEIEAVEKPHNPKLERLLMHCSAIPTRRYGRESLIDFLISKGSLESLRVLDVGISMYNMRSMGKLIRTLGPQLEELHIGFVSPFGRSDTDLSSEPFSLTQPFCAAYTCHETDMLESIDLTQSVNLQRLVLSRPAHPLTRDLLSRVVSPHVHTIEFGPDFIGADTQQLEETLCAPNFSQLAEVCFVTKYNPNKREDVVKSKYQLAFPRLHERGILQVARTLD
ncbi:hypothetical protein EUX98_g7211 [Antrodiella citrinella]|uniref:F-box domain-containing protein n=1 Tax=Antrodiella citrinella TaxID=2447956 RepID=A0A4S4MMQ3_9APHY|nr:hypothetical protein EUX98_g7211 [Antrodiella citrinella]